MNIKNKIVSLLSIFLIVNCSIAPGMHMESSGTWLDDKRYVYIDSLQKEIQILEIDKFLNEDYADKFVYKIDNGDQIAVTIWGLPDVFPITNINRDQNLRRVDSNGNIFFPYSGIIRAAGKTQNELRQDLTVSLGKYFNDPQVDVSIVGYNSQKVFILGEVTKPIKLNISDVPISLADAIGESKGLNVNTASGSEVFVIRQSNESGGPYIFHANLKNPSGFINAGKFYLLDNDIIYVNSSSTARWNKVISQFFPFSSFLNSVDNLTSD